MGIHGWTKIDHFEGFCVFLWKNGYRVCYLSDLLKVGEFRLKREEMVWFL